VWFGGEGPIVEGECAAGRGDEAADHVEEGGLAGAVRADHADGAAGRHLQGDVVEGEQAAETHADVVKGKHLTVLGGG